MLGHITPALHVFMILIFFQDSFQDQLVAYIYLLALNFYVQNICVHRSNWPSVHWKQEWIHIYQFTRAQKSVISFDEVYLLSPQELHDTKRQSKEHHYLHKPLCAAAVSFRAEIEMIGSA